MLPSASFFWLFSLADAFYSNHGVVVVVRFVNICGMRARRVEACYFSNVFNYT